MKPLVCLLGLLLLTGCAGLRQPSQNYLVQVERPILLKIDDQHATVSLARASFSRPERSYLNAYGDERTSATLSIAQDGAVTINTGTARGKEATDNFFKYLAGILTALWTYTKLTTTGA